MKATAHPTLISVEEAIREVLSRVVARTARPLPLGEALGCRLAEDVAADLDSPPFDKALVDGFAVRAADLDGGGRRLRVGEEIAAGRVPSRPLAPGEAALIMTGAPLPRGADAVVMVERTRREGADVLLEEDRVAPGQNRMTRGQEMRAGDVVLRAGARLNPARLGLLAAVGREEVRAIPRPTLAVLPTGDELVEPDRVPGPGQIRNSNATLLTALAAACDARAEAMPITPDEPEALGAAIRRGLEADVLLITGGVSAGNRDLVPGTLDDLGVARVFHKVRVRPGKPLWFGVGPARRDQPGTLVFGLPGNPVSGVVGFVLFVWPALDLLRGDPARLDRGRGPLAERFVHRGDRETYHPARWEATAGGPALRPLAWSASADLRPLAEADGFAIFPAGDRTYAEGEPVAFLPLP